MKPPMIQSTTSTFSAVSSTTITPLANVQDGHSILISVNCHTNGHSVTSITDTNGNTYFNLGGTNSTGSQFSTWVAKNVIGGTPTITINLSTSTAGEVVFLEAVGLSPGKTVATTLDPNNVSTAQSGATTSVFTNQFTTMPAVRSQGSLWIVVSTQRTSVGISTVTAGWDYVYEPGSSGGLGVFWRLGGGVGVPGTFFAVGTQPSATCLSTFMVLDFMQKQQVNHGIKPHPFSPGLAR